MDWWDRRLVLLALVAATIVPMLVVGLVPLTDLPGHMGRYRVQLDLADNAALARFYTFEWALIGNLGVDLLVVPLAPLLGLEDAVKAIVGSIPALTVAGFLLVARAVHGRVPPAALFALPLAYGYPFHFGFVNFALSMALALLALALWLHLAPRARLRAALFVPIGLILWVAHVYGWALLALLACTAELARQHRNGARWHQALLRTALHGLALAPPLLLMLIWRSDASGASFGWFDWAQKWGWLKMALRDRWQMWDIATAALLCVIIFAALALQLRRPRKSRFDPGLGLGALLLAAAFLLAPSTVIGSAYADMRLVPFALAVALLAIRPDAWGRRMNALALAGLAVFAARTAGTTASFALHDRAWRTELVALDRLPTGAKLATFLPQHCPLPWGTPRFDHLPSLALVRRGAFANDQWTISGAQLLSVRYAPGGWFVRDPSQFVASGTCRIQARQTLDEALARFPRAAFDHVWLINPPRHDPRQTRGLRPIWRSGTSVLFHVER